MGVDTPSLSSFELELREREAEEFDLQYAALHGPWFVGVEREVVRSLLRLDRTDVLLDFGCGTGRLALPLARICRIVHAVDRSAASLRVLDERAIESKVMNLSTLVHDVTEPLDLAPPPTKILSVGVLQHIPSREARLRALRNAFDVLVPGGLALFVSENFGLVQRLRGRPHEIAGDRVLYFHKFAASEAMEDLIAAGFERPRVFGLGTVYWTRYSLAPRILAKIDTLLPFVPGTHILAKFIATLCVKSPGRDLQVK